MGSLTFTFDKSLYNMFDELVTYTSLDGRIKNCNKAFLKFTEKKKKAILDKKDFKLLNLTFDELQYEKLLHKEYVKYDESSNVTKGKKVFFETKQRIVVDENGQPALLTIRKDLTKVRTNFVIYKEYKKFLKQIANGKSLQELLENLILAIEKHDHDMLCSVLFLDKSGKRLFTAAAPSLPSFYVEKINGMEIGAEVGSCGAAVSLQKRIIVEDIQKHKNWQQAKNLALSANLYACWSQPIFSSLGEVLGTFAIYYNRPKKPSKFDLFLIKDAASIAGIALEKHKNELQISLKNEIEKKQEQLLLHKSKQAMMGEMLENIAHQWRQPLSAISACATGLQLKKEVGDCSEEYLNESLENINLNTQYLSQTIEDFRHYFKSNNKKETFNIADAYFHTLKLISARLKAQNIHVVEKLENVEIESMQNELIQVFMNIFNNCLDELEKLDNDKRIIKIKINRVNGDVIIKIVDSAGGVSGDLLHRIFEPYFTTKHQLQGTGIGLYMCKEIIEKHLNGSIEARNNGFKESGSDYKGLEIIITLPIS